MNQKAFATIGACLIYADGNVEQLEEIKLWVALEKFNLNSVEARSLIDCAKQSVLDALKAGKSIDSVMAEAVAMCDTHDKAKIFDFACDLLVGTRDLDGHRQDGLIYGNFTAEESERLVSLRTALGIEEAEAIRKLVFTTALQVWYAASREADRLYPGGLSGKAEKIVHAAFSQVQKYRIREEA